jgi:hypothetical protein
MKTVSEQNEAGSSGPFLVITCTNLWSLQFTLLFPVRLDFPWVQIVPFFSNHSTWTDFDLTSSALSPCLQLPIDSPPTPIQQPRHTAFDTMASTSAYHDLQMDSSFTFDAMTPPLNPWIAFYSPRAPYQSHHRSPAESIPRPQSYLPILLRLPQRKFLYYLQLRYRA